MALGLGQLGLFSQGDLLVSIIGTGLVFLGVSIGGAIRLRLSEDWFRKSILAMLTVMGLSLIASSLL